MIFEGSPNSLTETTIHQSKVEHLISTKVKDSSV